VRVAAIVLMLGGAVMIVADVVSAGFAIPLIAVGIAPRRRVRVGSFPTASFQLDGIAATLASHPRGYGPSLSGFLDL
jgi:hypothetical protein